METPEYFNYSFSKDKSYDFYRILFPFKSYLCEIKYCKFNVSIRNNFYQTVKDICESIF